jgi:hypothetical protein
VQPGDDEQLGDEVGGEDEGSEADQQPRSPPSCGRGAVGALVDGLLVQGVAPREVVSAGS